MKKQLILKWQYLKWCQSLFLRYEFSSKIFYLYVEHEAVQREVAYARRMFADNGWPVIDVTRRSIEETAAAIITLCNERATGSGTRAE